MHPARPLTCGNDGLERHRELCYLRIGARREYRFRRGKMGHHAFQPQRRSRCEARQQVCHRAHLHPLAGHPGIDFQVNRDASRRQPADASLGFEEVELPRFPHHRGQGQVHHLRGFPGEQAGHQKNAAAGADRPHRGALFG